MVWCIFRIHKLYFWVNITGFIHICAFKGLTTQIKISYLRVVFHRRLSSIEGRPPLKVFFPRRSFSIEVHLPSKGVFHQKLSSIEGDLASKVVFHWRSSFIKGHLALKVLFHQRLSSIASRLSLFLDQSQFSKLLLDQLLLSKPF